MALASTVAVALAVTPTGGSWLGEKGNLSVNSAGTRVTAINAQKCRTAFVGAKIADLDGSRIVGTTSQWLD